MLDGLKGRGLLTPGGLWEVHLLCGHNGTLYVGIQTPGDGEPVILQALKESDFDNLVEIMKSALEPDKVITRGLE
jgi:hypothetical protein